jgi:hypothetical protein
MKLSLKIAAIGLCLAGGAVATGMPALAADVSVGVNAGGIAFGYSDGYWDRGHNWHAWENEQAAAKFRAENHEHYYERKHDADKDKGWRESDHWWDKH